MSGYSGGGVGGGGGGRASSFTAALGSPAPALKAAAAASKLMMLKTRRAATATDLRRRVTDLQSTNEMLLSFLTTLPASQLEAAPEQLRAILPSPTLEQRPHTVLPTMAHKRAELENASPPADMSPDAPPSLTNRLPSLMEPRRVLGDSTPKPAAVSAAAKKQQAAELRRAIDAAEASLDLPPQLAAMPAEASSSSRLTPMASATPSSEVKLLSSQKVPQLNMQSLDELRKDLFSPATIEKQMQGLGLTTPPGGFPGSEVDESGYLLNSTMLSPVVEARAKQSAATPDRNLRVVIPKSVDRDSSGNDAVLTPLKQARMRARESEAEAGASLASLATPLRNKDQRTPGSSQRTPLSSAKQNRQQEARNLASPSSMAGARADGGSVAPTPTRKRAPGAGRKTPDSTRMTPKNGRRTPKTGGLATPKSLSTPKNRPGHQQQLLSDPEDDVEPILTKKEKKKVKGRRGPTRDCFMSRNGNFKKRPGTLVDSGEDATSMRKVADERVKKAAERHAQILEDRKVKAAKNHARIAKAGARKAERAKKELEAAQPATLAQRMAAAAAAAAPVRGARNMDDVPVSENHRGQTRALTSEEEDWRQQQLAGSEVNEEKLERRQWEAEEMTRVASVRRGHSNGGLVAERSPEGGPRLGVPGGGVIGEPAVPEEYLMAIGGSYEEIDPTELSDRALGQISCVQVSESKSDRARGHAERSDTCTQEIAEALSGFQEDCDGGRDLVEQYEYKQSATTFQFLGDF